MAFFTFGNYVLKLMTNIKIHKTNFLPVKLRGSSSNLGIYTLR